MAMTREVGGSALDGHDAGVALELAHFLVVVIAKEALSFAGRFVKRVRIRVAVLGFPVRVELGEVLLDPVVERVEQRLAKVLGVLHIGRYGIRESAEHGDVLRDGAGSLPLFLDEIQMR